MDPRLPGTGPGPKPRGTPDAPHTYPHAAAHAGLPEGPDECVRAGSVIMPGGKVDPDAIREAIERARASGEEGADEEQLRTVVFELRKDLRKRLDRYLTDRIAFMSRNQLQKLIDEGGVTVNARAPKASTVLRAGDVVEVVVPPQATADIVPEDIPLDIMFEDRWIIVINKRPDIVVHPARSHLTGTMLGALAYHLRFRSSGELSGVGREFARPGVVHRLDRHTSGCIVFAKDDEAHWKLGRQFEQRRVDKRYLAVVHGRVEPDSDVIQLPVGPHPSREKGYREKYVVRHDELGKPATTIYRVRERYELPGPDKPRHFSLVELELLTGRTHQIRVHLSHNLWPIVGDDMYTGRPFDDEHGRVVIARQALHACVLGFAHPLSDEPLRFVAPLRGDMLELVDQLRRRATRLERPEVPGATIDLARVLPEGR